MRLRDFGDEQLNEGPLDFMKRSFQGHKQGGFAGVKHANSQIGKAEFAAQQSANKMVDLTFGDWLEKMQALKQAGSDTTQPTVVKPVLDKFMRQSFGVDMSPEALTQTDTTTVKAYISKGIGKSKTDVPQSKNTPGTSNTSSASAPQKMSLKDLTSAFKSLSDSDKAAFLNTLFPSKAKGKGQRKK